MNIRLYRPNDWNILKSWWTKVNQPFMTEEMMTSDSTFILEFDNKPVASITLYLTNCKEVAYVENLIRDPEFHNRDAINGLIGHMEKFAKEKGCKRLVVLSNKDKLNKKYESIGYFTTCYNMSCLVKELY